MKIGKIKKACEDLEGCNNTRFRYTVLEQSTDGVWNLFVFEYHLKNSSQLDYCFLFGCNVKCS